MVLEVFILNLYLNQFNYEKKNTGRRNYPFLFYYYCITYFKLEITTRLGILNITVHTNYFNMGKTYI